MNANLGPSLFSNAAPSEPVAPVPLGIEGMFQQIMQAVQKSVRVYRFHVAEHEAEGKAQNAEISDLKNECAELRLANASLERQIREGQVRVGVRGPRLVFSYSRFAERTVPYTGDPHASSL